MIIVASEVQNGTVSHIEGVVFVMFMRPDGLLNMEFTEAAALRLARRIVDVVEDHTHSQRVTHGETET